MNTLTNINSHCDTITDARLNELLPEVPAAVRIDFYGHVRTKQTGYGTWRVVVELDINGTKDQYGYTTHDEHHVLALNGNDQFTDEEQADALDSALVMAFDENEGSLSDAIFAAAQQTEEDAA